MIIKRLSKTAFIDLFLEITSNALSIAAKLLKPVDKKIGSFTLRQQVLTDFPPKELRNVVDQSKKDIKEGIVVGFATFEGKVGVAVGVTNELTKKYDAVTLVKIASEVLKGKGGGCRKDFAQAGGTNKDKIDEAFKALSKKIN